METRPEMMPQEGDRPEIEAGTIMTKRRLDEANSTLQEYKNAKKRLETRLLENDKWYRLHHWDSMDGKGVNEAGYQQKSAWLLNSLLNKHADAMDNYPEANVLPREESDKQTAATLSSVLPTILDHNRFKSVYSDAWWDKLKMGTAVYGVFWNQRKANGLGDIDIRVIDLVNLFGDPGISNIQDSRNLFNVEQQDIDVLKATYPDKLDKITGGSSGFDLSKYDTEDHIDDSKKALVVDWYYKVNVGGRDILHFCKFCEGELLYSSEEDVAHAENGFYADGLYPFVFDVLFPTKGSPAGFGYIDTMKDTQERIDKVGSAITTNAMLRSKKRFFSKAQNGVNEAEFSDWTKDIVHVEGNSLSESIQEIRVDGIGSDIVTAYQSWIEELKETSGNRDFSQGGTTSGVTAASAIAALQEAGSKLSRDMLSVTFEAYEQICKMVIERIRQFYDMPRVFRIIGERGAEQFITMDNSQLGVQQDSSFGMTTESMPVFDISVKAQRANPYTKMSTNELALSFYHNGFFNPQMTDQALLCLDMMDFDGREQLMQKIAQNGTMYQQMMQMQQQMLDMAAIIDEVKGTNLTPTMAAAFGAEVPASAGGQGAVQSNVDINSIGAVQPANNIAARVKSEVAGHSDPNGGVA